MQQLTASVGMAAMLFVALEAARRRRRRSAVPSWFTELQKSGQYELLRIDEWERGWIWRLANGWLGTDYVHGVDAAVHVAGYLLGKTPEGHAKLIGAVHFGPGAESHKTLCHGGTMCAAMDDAMGWVGFCVSGRCQPWSGFTVQVNTSLQAPIAVGSWLRLEGEIYGVERRKVRVRATLTAPAVDGADAVTHCTGDGLFVVKKGESNDPSPSPSRPAATNKS